MVESIGRVFGPPSPERRDNRKVPPVEPVFPVVPEPHSTQDETDVPFTTYDSKGRIIHKDDLNRLPDFDESV